MDQLAARNKARAEAMDVDPPADPLAAPTLERLEQRRAIIEHILSGAIAPAVDALNAHFPAVLQPAPAASNPRARVAATHASPVFARSTEPEHVALNLQIQQFIEHFRQIVPSAPSSPASSIGSLNGSSSAPLNEALLVLSEINAAASKLAAYPRSVYLQEFRDVGGLLAYTDPENSELAGFLDQERRVALAAQVNAAILRESPWGGEKGEGVAGWRSVELDLAGWRLHGLCGAMMPSATRPMPSCTPGPLLSPPHHTHPHSAR
jgi:hypothetical protein